MASKLNLTNANGKKLTVANLDTNFHDREVDLSRVTHHLSDRDALKSRKGTLGDVVLQKDIALSYEWVEPQEVDNGGTIINVDGDTTGSWKAIYSGAVNVKWFGAKGDGVTDDTSAIQQAVNFYNHLEFNDSYITTSQITITNRQEFKLVGNGIITLKTSQFKLGRPPSDEELYPDNNPSDYIRDNNIYVFKFDSVNNVIIKNIKFYTTAEYDLGWVDKYPINKYGGYKCGYLGKINGIHIWNADNVVLDSLHIEGFSPNGVLIQRDVWYVDSLIVTNCKFIKNKSCGLRVENTRNIEVSSSLFKDIGFVGGGNTGYGVSLGQTVEGRKPCLSANIHDNIFINSCRKFIDTHDALDVKITNNEFKNAGRTYISVYSQNAEYSSSIKNAIVIKGNKGRNNSRYIYHNASVRNSPRANAEEWNTTFPDKSVTVPDDTYDPNSNGDTHIDSRYLAPCSIVVGNTYDDNTSVIEYIDISSNDFTMESFFNDLPSNYNGTTNIYTRCIDLHKAYNNKNIFLLNNNFDFTGISSDSSFLTFVGSGIISCRATDDIVKISNNYIKSGISNTQIDVKGKFSKLIVDNNVYYRLFGRISYINIDKLVDDHLLVLIDKNNIYNHGSTGTNISTSHITLANGDKDDANSLLYIGNNNTQINVNNAVVKQKAVYGGTLSDSLSADNTSSYFLVTDKIQMFDLPTADPAVVGQLWNDGGIVKVSAD